MRLIGRTALLVALWLLAWGQITVGNVVSGVAVAAGLLVAFPPAARVATHVGVNAVAVGRLLGYVLVQLVTSNIVMTRQILSRRPDVRSGVLAHRLHHPSEHVVTIMTSVIALSPGTMTVDVDAASTTIYVHFLLLRDVDEARLFLERLDRLATRAIGGSTPHTSSPDTGAT